MSRNKVDELTRHAVAQVQKLAKDQGFKRLPNEKAFMDELSGEDDDDEDWPHGEGWAAVCYDDERA